MMILACVNLLPELYCYLSYRQSPLSPTATRDQKVYMYVPQAQVLARQLDRRISATSTGGGTVNSTQPFLQAIARDF